MQPGRSGLGVVLPLGRLLALDGWLLALDGWLLVLAGLLALGRLLALGGGLLTGGLLGADLDLLALAAAADPAGLLGRVAGGVGVGTPM